MARGTTAALVTMMVMVAAPAAQGQSVDSAATQLQLTPEQQVWLDAHPVIHFGPYQNYAPLQFLDEHGVHRGLGADYTNLVQEKLGVQFTNVIAPTWQELLERAQAREIDVIALAADTPERRAYLSFTKPYLELPAAIIARSSVDRRLTARDLVGMRVCVVEGYAAHEYLATNYPDMLLEPVPHTRVGLARVSLGMSDAFVSDLAVASHYIEEEAITNLRVVGESGYVYRMGFAVRSDWPELTTMIDQALATITPAQKSEIFNRWITLSHETEFASRRLMNTLAIILGAAVIAVVAFIMWNRTLQRRVEEKTAALEGELAERQRVAEALRTSEERIRLIVNSSQDAVVTIDEQGQVTGWTSQAETMFGWTREEVFDRPLTEFIIPPQHRQAHDAGIRRYLSTGEEVVLNRLIEMTALRKDGTEFPVELSIASLPKQDKIEFAGFVRDISVRKRNEAELTQHRERLEELVVERTAEACSARDAAEEARGLLTERVAELEKALAEVKQLRGLLPICSYCKRIREGEDYHRSVEAYLAEHSDATFSHGICPDCYAKHVEPELEQL